MKKRCDNYLFLLDVCTEFQGKSVCYRLIKEDADYDAALSKCKQLGGTLAVPENEAVNEVIFGIVRDALGASSSQVKWVKSFIKQFNRDRSYA